MFRAWVAWSRLHMASATWRAKAWAEASAELKFMIKKAFSA
jgi:hypothetical protein